jgi:proteic killer suppression protein
MIVTFEKGYLQELYETGKTSDKKHRFQPDIIFRYINCIDIITDAPDIRMLYKYNSLNFEALKGDKAGLYSIRVNHQYRIEFTIEGEETEPITTICNIIELSNHYK